MKGGVNRFGTVIRSHWSVLKTRTAQRFARRALRFCREYRFINGVTEMPCTTMETATVARVSDTIRSANSSGNPWFRA